MLQTKCFCYNCPNQRKISDDNKMILTYCSQQCRDGSCEHLNTLLPPKCSRIYCKNFSRFCDRNICFYKFCGTKCAIDDLHDMYFRDEAPKCNLNNCNNPVLSCNPDKLPNCYYSFCKKCIYSLISCDTKISPICKEKNCNESCKNTGLIDKMLYNSKIFYSQCQQCLS